MDAEDRMWFVKGEDREDSIALKYIYKHDLFDEYLDFVSKRFYENYTE